MSSIDTGMQTTRSRSVPARVRASWALAEARHRDAPDFLGIGMQKAGTRWLYDQLQAHRRVWLPPVKELHFFDRVFDFKQASAALDESTRALIRNGASADPRALDFLRRAVLSADARDAREVHASLAVDRQRNSFDQWYPSRELLDWYGELFTSAPLGMVTGDITPAYSTLSTEKIRLIRERFPELRIVLGVRHPVDRAWSQLCQAVRRRNTTVDAINDPRWVAKRLRSRAYDARSHPMQILDRWADVFDADRIAVYVFEQMVAEPAATRNQLASFLGLGTDPSAFAIAPRHDAKANHRRFEMSAEIRKLLTEHFIDDISNTKHRLAAAERYW